MNKPKRIKKIKTTKQFTCLVDAKLLEKCNNCRRIGWREMIENAMESHVRIYGHLKSQGAKNA
jgi:hypothetical protein